MSTCGRCGKDFVYPTKLRRHQKRKTPCAPILEKEDLPDKVQEDPDLGKKKCRFCGRAFSSYSAMRRHVRNNCKIAPNKKNGDAGMELLYEHTIRKQQIQIAQLTTLVDRLLTSQQSGKQNPGATNDVQGDHNSVGNQINQTNTFNISVFGSESLEHVNSAVMKRILDESRKLPELALAAETALLKTAMLIYSDPEHPENLTCYLPNKKGDETLVHTDAGWEVRPTRLVLPPMAQTSKDEIFQKQPYVNVDDYGPLLIELRDNEKRYTGGQALRPILVRNKDLLRRALETLPVAGDE